MPRRWVVVFVVLVAVVTGTVLVLVTFRPPAPLGPSGSGPVAPVWPTPQQMQPRADGFRLPAEVGVVADPDADPGALDIVESALRDSGVGQVPTGPDDPHTTVTVWLSGTDAPLAGLGVAGPDGLAAEGYVLAAGMVGDRAEIVLAGVDAAGSYYAAQTLRQLIQRRGARGWMPGVSIRDWPSMAVRGTVEGFYGPLWTQAERLDHLDFLAAHKMNSYEYSPKDDSYLRANWRDPFPPDRLAQVRELVDTARLEHIELMFALSPGLSICFSSDEDLAALIAKLESLYALGVRSFDLPFDDIDPGALHCPGDGVKYGTGGAAAAAAQADVVNAVNAWAHGKGDVHRLQTVPTEYFDTADSPYKKALRENLDPDVIVLWTGVGVIPASITAAQIAAARTVFGHDILIWDNYPVNDYIAGRLPLAPYSGRGPGLSGNLIGMLANPANQAAVSKVSLFSAADLTWHDTSHDPDAAWSAALAELAGGDAATIDALKLFIDLSTKDGTLHTVQAPELAAAITAFWQRFGAGDPMRALATLRPRVDALATAPSRIRAGVRDPAFANQAKVWLDATAMLGQSMRAALDGLAATIADDGPGVLAAQKRIEALRAPLAALRDPRRPETPPVLGDGVIDTFLSDVGNELLRWQQQNTPG